MDLALEEKEHLGNLDENGNTYNNKVNLGETR
jgi:hypothetical protein